MRRTIFLFISLCLAFLPFTGSALTIDFTQNPTSEHAGPVLKKRPLNPDLQDFVLSALREELAPSFISTNAAVVVLNNHTGELLSYVSGVGPNEQDKASVPEEAAGILDPFLEALALKEVLLDRKALLGKGSTSWQEDLNLEKLLFYLGNEKIFSHMKRLGFRKFSSDFTKPGALKRARVSLWELANAYRIFANGGLYSSINMKGQFLKRKHRVLPMGVSYSMVNSLSLRSKAWKDIAISLSDTISLSFWTAFHLGASSDGTSNWCVGFSKNYTVGVWFGLVKDGNFTYASNEAGELMEKTLILWSKIMDQVENKAGILVPSRRLASNKDRFKKDRLRNLRLSSIDRISLKDSTWQRILYPKHGMLVEVDSLEPEKNYKMRLQVHPPSEALQLAINGIVLGNANTDLLWNLKLGKHILTLSDQYDNVIDKVHFEVR